MNKVNNKYNLNEGRKAEQTASAVGNAAWNGTKAVGRGISFGVSGVWNALVRGSDKALDRIINEFTLMMIYGQQPKKSFLRRVWDNLRKKGNLVRALQIPGENKGTMLDDINSCMAEVYNMYFRGEVTLEQIQGSFTGLGINTALTMSSDINTIGKFIFGEDVINESDFSINVNEIKSRKTYSDHERDDVDDPYKEDIEDDDHDEPEPHEDVEDDNIEDDPRPVPAPVEYLDDEVEDEILPDDPDDDNIIPDRPEEDDDNTDDEEDKEEISDKIKKSFNTLYDKLCKQKLFLYATLINFDNYCRRYLSVYYKQSEDVTISLQRLKEELEKGTESPIIKEYLQFAPGMASQCRSAFINFENLVKEHKTLQGRIELFENEDVGNVGLDKFKEKLVSEFIPHYFNNVISKYTEETFNIQTKEFTIDIYNAIQEYYKSLLESYIDTNQELYLKINYNKMSDSVKHTGIIAKDEVILVMEDMTSDDMFEEYKNIIKKVNTEKGTEYKFNLKDTKGIIAFMTLLSELYKAYIDEIKTAYEIKDNKLRIPIKDEDKKRFIKDVKELTVKVRSKLVTFLSSVHSQIKKGRITKEDYNTVREAYNSIFDSITSKRDETLKLVEQKLVEDPQPVNPADDEGLLDIKKLKSDLELKKKEQGLKDEPSDDVEDDNIKPEVNDNPEEGEHIIQSLYKEKINTISLIDYIFKDIREVRSESMDLLKYYGQIGYNPKDKNDIEQSYKAMYNSLLAYFDAEELFVSKKDAFINNNKNVIKEQILKVINIVDNKSKRLSDDDKKKMIMRVVKILQEQLNKLHEELKDINKAEGKLKNLIGKQVKKEFNKQFKIIKKEQDPKKQVEMLNKLVESTVNKIDKLNLSKARVAFYKDVEAKLGKEVTEEIAQLHFEMIKNEYVEQCKDVIAEPEKELDKPEEEKELVQPTDGPEEITDEPSDDEPKKRVKSSDMKELLKDVGKFGLELGKFGLEAGKFGLKAGKEIGKELLGRDHDKRKEDGKQKKEQEEHTKQENERATEILAVMTNVLKEIKKKFEDEGLDDKKSLIKKLSDGDNDNFVEDNINFDTIRFMFVDTQSLVIYDTKNEGFVKLAENKQEEPEIVESEETIQTHDENVTSIRNLNDINNYSFKLKNEKNLNDIKNIIIKYDLTISVLTLMINAAHVDHSNIFNFDDKKHGYDFNNLKPVLFNHLPKFKKIKDNFEILFNIIKDDYLADTDLRGDSAKINKVADKIIGILTQFNKYVNELSNEVVSEINEKLKVHNLNSEELREEINELIGETYDHISINSFVEIWQQTVKTKNYIDTKVGIGLVEFILLNWKRFAYFANLVEFGMENEISATAFFGAKEKTGGINTKGRLLGNFEQTMTSLFNDDNQIEDTTIEDIPYDSEEKEKWRREYIKKIFRSNNNNKGIGKDINKNDPEQEKKWNNINNKEELIKQRDSKIQNYVNKKLPDFTNNDIVKFALDTIDKFKGKLGDLPNKFFNDELKKSKKQLATIPVHAHESLTESDIIRVKRLRKQHGGMLNNYISESEFNNLDTLQLLESYHNNNSFNKKIVSDERMMEICLLYETSPMEDAICNRLQDVFTFEDMEILENVNEDLGLSKPINELGDDDSNTIMSTDALFSINFSTNEIKANKESYDIADLHRLISLGGAFADNYLNKSFSKLVTDMLAAVTQIASDRDDLREMMRDFMGKFMSMIDAGQDDDVKTRMFGFGSNIRATNTGQGKYMNRVTKIADKIINSGDKYIKAVGAKYKKKFTKHEVEEFNDFRLTSAWEAQKVILQRGANSIFESLYYMPAWGTALKFYFNYYPVAIYLVSAALANADGRSVPDTALENAKSILTTKIIN